MRDFTGKAIEISAVTRCKHLPARLLTYNKEMDRFCLPHLTPRWVLGLSAVSVTAALFVFDMFPVQAFSLTPVLAQPPVNSVSVSKSVVITIGSQKYVVETAI